VAIFGMVLRLYQWNPGHVSPFLPFSACQMGQNLARRATAALRDFCPPPRHYSILKPVALMIGVQRASSAPMNCRVASGPESRIGSKPDARRGGVTSPSALAWPGVPAG